MATRVLNLERVVITSIEQQRWRNHVYSNMFLNTLKTERITLYCQVDILSGGYPIASTVTPGGAHPQCILLFA